MSENFHLESGYLNASTKKRHEDIDIKYQKSIDENELTPNNASKEHNDLLRNAEKKAYKAYKKPDTGHNVTGVQTQNEPGPGSNK